jgi:hypothetical protein
MNENIKKLTDRVIALEKAVFGDKKNQKKVNIGFDFLLNERAFVKRYLVDKSGPKKFTGLLAYLSKGENNKNIELSEIKNHWGKMETKSLLGKFNMFYPNDAKTRGWVDSKEYGLYNLTDEWQNAL